MLFSGNLQKRQRRRHQDLKEPHGQTPRRWQWKGKGTFSFNRGLSMCSVHSQWWITVSRARGEIPDEGEAKEDDKDVLEYLASIKRDEEMDKISKELREKRGEKSLMDMHDKKLQVQETWFSHWLMNLEVNSVFRTISRKRAKSWPRPSRHELPMANGGSLTETSIYRPTGSSKLKLFSSPFLNLFSSHRFDAAQKAQMLKRAAQLNDRFSSGGRKYL